jgi:hypothetical protein
MQATELRRAVLDLQVRDLVAASVAGGRGAEGGSNGLRCVPLGSREGASCVTVPRPTCMQIHRSVLCVNVSAA